MEQAQDYSFNKSHAACYALIAYHTAYLKANYPAEYMAALISLGDEHQGPRALLRRRLRARWASRCSRPTSTSRQQASRSVGGKIRFGLNAVKNVGENAVRAIIAAREEAAGRSPRSSTSASGSILASPTSARSRSLVKAGALDSTKATRRGMLDVLEQALASGNRKHSDRMTGQESIFDLAEDEPVARPTMHPAIPSHEFERKELLALEKESLGLYVSEHPLQGYQASLRRQTDCPLSDLERRRDGEIVAVAGMIGAVRQLTTRKGDSMAFVRLDDLSGSSEVVVFSTLYATVKPILEPDRIVLVKGRVDHKEGESKLIGLEFTELELHAGPDLVTLKVDARHAHAGTIRELAQVVLDYPGESPVLVVISTGAGARTFRLGAGYRVRPEADFFAEVKALLGEAAVA